MGRNDTSRTMKIEIVEISTKHFEIYLDRLGFVGHIFEFEAKPFIFKWVGDNWKRMTYEENAAVLAAVGPKVTMLNITRRLTR